METRSASALHPVHRWRRTRSADTISSVSVQIFEFSQRLNRFSAPLLPNTQVQRLNEKVHEMLAERDDAMHKMFTGEISEKELKAMNKACTEASKGWKQAANIALKARSQARRQAAQKWGFRPDDQFIVMGDMRGRISSHRTVDYAIKAAKRDRQTCKHQSAGAYSDVLVYLIDLDGELHAVDEHAYENQE